MPKQEHDIAPVPMIWNELPCLDFVDSTFADHTGSGRRFDRLARSEWQRAFLAHWGWSAPVPAPADQLAALRRLRPRMRALLERGSLAGPDVSLLNGVLAGAPFVYAIVGESRLEAVPLERNWEWIAAELVRSAVVAVGSKDPERIKVCANPDCTWLFYDTTLNRSRRWCQTNICGNLVKVRQHRAAHGKTIPY